MRRFMLAPRRVRWRTGRRRVKCAGAANRRSMREMAGLRSSFHRGSCGVCNFPSRSRRERARARWARLGRCDLRRFPGGCTGFAAESACWLPRCPSWPDGAVPLARQGKILNCVVIYCFPPASRRGRRRFARRVRVCAPWGGALVLLCAAGRPQCVGNRGVQNLPSRPARAGPRPVGAAGTIRFAAVYREAARALQRCGSPRNRRSMRKMAAFCFSSPL